MTIRIGNAPCSWGVEFADDPRNPTWREVLKQNAEAGYKGIELGPVGFMPEDPAELGDGLAEHDLELIGGVVFRPYHDVAAWDDTLDGTVRTCKALAAHGAKHLVLIDSISPRRAPTAGRATEAEQMDKAEWTAYRDRITELHAFQGYRSCREGGRRGQTHRFLHRLRAGYFLQSWAGRC